MEAKVVRPQVEAIQARFFEALEMLIESNELSGLKAFCDTYELHRPKYSNIRTYLRDKNKPGTGYKLIDIDALAYLVRDFNVSSDWLLLGKGGMFRK